MSYIKTILLSSTLSLSLLSMGALSQAAEDDATASTSAKLHAGGYAEIGGDFGMSNLFQAKADEELEITAKSSVGFNIGFGGSFAVNPKTLVSGGLEISHIDSEVSYDLIDKTLFSSDSEKWGGLHMNTVLVKLTVERLLGDHFTSYVAFGFGGASYEILDNNNFKAVRYSPKYGNPLFSVGIGAKAYFNKSDGAYLSAGLNYTKIAQDELKIHDLHGLKVIGGMGTTQAEIRLGFRF